MLILEFMKELQFDCVTKVWRARILPL